MLDTLGASLATRPFRLGPDSATFLVLAVPSAATIIRDACPTPTAGQGRFVIGRVNDPETLKPVAGAEVSIAWTPIQVSKQTGIRRTPHVVRDTTNEAGRSDLRTARAGLVATLQARKGTVETAEVPVSLGDRDTGLLTRSLLLSPAAAGPTVGKARFSGRVILRAAPRTRGVESSWLALK